jgi:hypothetical protein
MFVVFPIGTPTLYAALLYASSKQLERIRRAEVTAEADKTKFMQRDPSIDLADGQLAIETAEERTASSRWTARASPSMQAMVESENAAREEASQLRSQLPSAVQQLTDGCSLMRASNRRSSARPLTRVA